MNTSINDLFYGNVSYDEKAAQAYQDVWLYDRDAEAKARVDANANAALYTMPGMKDTKGMALWARDYARMVSPHLAENPMDLTEEMIGRLKDDGMKQRYTQEFQQLQASGKDYADDYYSMYARMHQDVSHKVWDDYQTKVKGIEDSLSRMDAYISGADLTSDEETGKGFSQQDVDNVRSVLPAAKMAELDDMRAFARTYLRGLEKLEDGEQMIRGLKQLEDELHEIVGMDQEKAGLMYNVVMDWAQRVADSDKVGVGDEFVLSVEKTWGDFSNAAELANKRYTAGGYRVTGAAGGGPMLVEVSADEQARAAEWLAANKQKALARGVLGAGAQKAREIGKNTGWWKGMLRTGAAMAGDTSMYLIPVAGQYLGTISTLAGGQGTYEQLRAGGESDFAASVQSGVGTAVQAGVELLPFGKIGGKGLSAFLRAVAGESVAKGTSGAIAKWVVRNTQKSTVRALAADFGAGLIDEAALEPIVGGMATLGAEELIYALGAPKGEESREWTEHFAELREIWTDPKQLAGLALFTAALTGASTPMVRANVKYFERSRNMWEATGLTPEHVEEVLASEKPMETGRELLKAEKEADEAAVWERRTKANEKLLADGKVLFMTGASAAEMDVPELAPAYAAVWQEGVERGVLPEVKANADGTYTVREKGFAGKPDKELVLTPAAADAYLQAAMDAYEQGTFERLRKEVGEKKALEQTPDLRAWIHQGVEQIAGEAVARQTKEHGRFNVEEVTKSLPEHLAKLVRKNGSINRMLAARISDWAHGRLAALGMDGVDAETARNSKDYAAGAVRTLGEWADFATKFVRRAEQTGNPERVATSVFRAPNKDVALVDGARVLGSTIFGVRGRGTALNWLEDVTESVLIQLVQARAANEVEAGADKTREQAERDAWNALGEQVARARAAVLKADPTAKITEVKKDDAMSVVEAFSDISNSAFLTSGVVPKWMRPMTEMMKANVVAADTALTLAKAWEMALEEDPGAVQEMRDVLEAVGADVRDIVEETNITAEDIESWKLANAEARAVAYGPDGAGGAAVSEVVEQAEAEEEAIRAKEEPVSEERIEEVKEEVRAQEEHVEQVFQPSEEERANVPEEVKGVFVGDTCVYNAAGGFYMGLVDKSKLMDGIEQVKVGTKGKHGVIAGRELVGDFQASAAPLYVWKRKNGELWLISGRHRFELLLRDNGVGSHACYVFVEDAEHDEKWARMMDYENNMRDDQADEVTAAMYVRETGYDDAELKKRGLLRNESRSKRGALIGRWAREELWTRFVNGVIKPMDAEIICNLTKNIKDQSRIEEIQRRCCMLLEDGKGWEYIGAMVQLMANKEGVFLKQGLLDFGADFEADLARAATWIEKNLKKLNEAIGLMKQGRKLSGKKRAEAERLGIATQMEGGAELLADLEGLRAKFEMIGSYPDLVAQAQLWDGKTDVDPVGQLLEQQRMQRELEEGRKELDADEYLRAKQAEAVPTLSFSVGTETYTTRVLSKAYGTDSNGNKLSADTFVTTPMGNVDWYRFPQDEKTQKLLAKHEVKNLPIRLRVGKQNNREHNGYGFIHMLSHFDEYVEVGETPLLHLFNTLSNLVKIRGGAGGRYQFKGEYERGRDSLLIAQLMEEDGYYSIVSSYPTQMNRTPRRGELVIGRVLFQFPSNSKKAQIPVGKSKNDAVSTSASTSDQASQEKVAQTAQQVNIYDLQIRNANGEVIFQQGVEPKVTFSLTPEMESIKAEAVAAGTFMKAPNGKATNLTERQWLQVRTSAFKSWFGDWENDPANASKVVDENGEPMVVYHGSPTGGFTIFRNESYFSPFMWYAEKYKHPSASSNRSSRDVGTPMLYEVFLNIRKPFDTRNAAEKKIFETDFFRKWGNGAPLSERGLPDWTDASDLLEFIEENELDYDGLILDEGGYPDGNGSVILRGHSFVPVTPNQIKSATDNRGTFDGRNPDITFSIGEERNLAAVHSLSPEKFLAALELGGMPMPSVAVTRLDRPYSWGGADAINLVGRPEMVDPRNGAEVFTADAWTGYVPQIVHKVAGKEDRSAASMDLRDIKKKYQYVKDGDNTLHSLDYRISEGEKTYRYEMGEKLRSNAGKILFAWQSGYRPRPKMKDAVRTHEWLTRELAKKLMWYAQLPREEYEKRMHEMDTEIMSAVVQYYSNKDIVKNAPTPEKRERRLNTWVNTAMRAFWRDTPILLKQSLGDVENIGKRVLDTQANLEMLAKYADKHKRSFETWVEDKMNKWYSKERYIADTKKEATLDNITEYMLRKKGRNKENDKFIGYGQVRAMRAREMRSMEDIKGRREKLVDSKTSEEQKSKTNEQMYNWQYYAGQILNRNKTWHDTDVLDDLMRVLADVKGEPTAEKLRVAVNHKFRRETRTKVQELLNNEKVIGYGVEALKSLRAELEDYMEAVPQRAVKMNEWEYAVMPVSLKKNKAVMAGLRENGIRPRFHDGTEEGRRAALAGLVNDSRVSFSVVGEHAANWDELKGRAFRGRDDGKLRAEIDASGAMLKEGAFVGDAGDEYRRMLAGDMPAEMRDLLVKLSARKKLLDRWYEILDETDDLDAADAYSEEVGIDKDWLWEYGKMCDKLRAYIKERLAVAGVDGEGKFGTLERMSMPLMDSILDGKLNNDYAEELAKMSKGTMYTLKDMLDYPELYKAYPDLRWLPVYFADMGPFVRGKLLKGAYPEALYVNKSLPMDGVRSTLLHEIQHAIQVIEEFAAGGTGETARKALEQQIRQYRIRLEHLRKELQWINAVDVAKDHLKRMIRILKRPRAILKMGERFAVHEMMDVDVMAQQAIEMMWDEYTQMSIRDFGDTVAYAPGDGYKLPGRGSDVPTLDAVEKLLAKVNALPSRRQGKLRGRGKELERQIEQLYQENKPKLDMTDLSNSELYARLAGEIEARNVQTRRDWTAEERRARPFNETLEYPGEALVTYSMTDVAQQSLHLLETRRDELEAQVILEDMQKACERLSIVLAGDDDPKVGNGLQVYAEMQALISATRRALPEKYLRQGNLNGLLAWAGVYARMAQTGQMPKRGAIKGEIYDRFVRELSRKNELMQLQGMSEAEAREVLMDLGSAKLETAFLKVGRDCAHRLDAFLKDRALERINWLYKMAYPKREEGQAWTRGKMASDAYRLVEKVMGIIGRSHEQRAKVDEELKEVRREQRKIRQAMEDGQMPEEMGKRKLKVLRGRMDRLEAEAMAAAADEHAKLLEELNRQVEELEDGEQKEEQESRLAEEIALVQTFGNWYYKGAGEAVRAARVFEDIVMRGKADWENKLKLERERRAFLKARIAANFNVADKDVENVRAGDRAAFKGKMGSKVKALGKGMMSMGHLLLALRPKMGRDFCDEQRAKLARINEGFMAFNMELDGWMYRTIRDITGIDTKERQKVWMNQMEEIKDTGIFITNRRTEKIVLTYAEAVAWLNMDKDARAKERERVMAEAAQEKRKPQNIPTEEVMDELGELVQAYEKDKRGVEEDRKKFHLTHEVTWEEELRTTKGVLLFYLLTFEQPDYEHLMEVNGVSGATLDQMRRYIGPQMMKWGYAMREKLNEHGVLVADAFESYTGIPFGSRELYFKGVFDRGPMKERDEKAAVEQGSAAAGTRTKYGSLIPRRYHKAKVERVSATQVFVQAMQQQNNYVQTAEYVREWRGLLSDKEFAKRLEAELGAATMQILNGWIGVLEGAAAGDAAAARAATGIINRMLGGYAVTRLAGNIRTLIKQGSAILNGFAGGYVPEVVVRNGELVQEMAYRKLGLGEFMMALGRVLTFRGAVKKNMVTGQAYIAGRRDYEGKGLANTAMMEADQKVAGYVPEGGFLGWSKIPQQFWSWLGAKSAKATEVAMEAMGYVDSEMCAVSAMAVADAVYRQGKAEDKAGMVPDELLRAEALRIAGMALDIAAQPQVRTQKGYWAASGAFGAMGQFLYMFRSDTLMKVGLWGGQMTSGEKLPAAVGGISFGLLNAVIAELLVMLYGDLPDDDEELSEHALTFALNVLLGDVSALPVVGEAVGTVRNMIEGKHWAAQGGISEAVVPVVTLGSDIYREWKNIDKDAPAEKHWATVARLLRSLGATAAFYHESTTGALANMSSVAAAAAVAGNASTLFKGILKVIEDLEE